MKNHHSSGEIYIGVIIALGIFMMLSQAVILLANTGYELIGFTRARNVARLLMNQKMENARNLPYDNIGTVGGIPSGSIAQNETVAINGQQYKVQTTVLYVDDTFDNVSPADTVPNDYKRIRIDVSWNGFGTRSTTTTVVSDIAPKGVEKVTGGGTLSFLVFNSAGLPVPNASINVASSGLNPPVNDNVVTSDNGRIVIPGAPACVKCYRVTTTKSGYSTDRTYGAGEVANPSKSDLTVIAGGLTQMSFTIDQTATLTLNTVGTSAAGFPALGTQSLLVRGSKIIGTDTLDNPVYKYQQTQTTNTLGTITLSNMEWDSYSVSPATTSAQTSGGTNPLTAFLLSPNESKTFAISLPAKPTHSLLTAFVTSARVPIASVAATLKDNGVLVASSSAGLSSDPDFGQIFFNALSNKTYILEATASGYQSINRVINVNGNRYEEITLSP